MKCIYLLISFRPEYSRLVSENSPKQLKRKFVSKISGCFPPPLGNRLPPLDEILAAPMTTSINVFPFLSLLFLYLKKTSRSGDTPASYPECMGFKSRLEDRLSWQVFGGFPQSLWINDRIVLQIILPPIFSACFPVHYSLVILPFDA
jgi:hypothetical protein